MADIVERLRADGWTVAVHNDYRLGTVPMTFWLFTHPSGVWAKGEGCTDDEAFQSLLESIAERKKDADTIARQREEIGRLRILVREFDDFSCLEPGNMGSAYRYEWTGRRNHLRDKAARSALSDTTEPPHG